MCAESDKPFINKPMEGQRQAQWRHIVKSNASVNSPAHVQMEFARFAIVAQDSGHGGQIARERNFGRNLGWRWR
jgi:hypothetical protein